MWPSSFLDLKRSEWKTVQLHGLLCVVFFGDKVLFCCTHARGGFEMISGSRMGQHTPGTLYTVPQWTNSKEGLIWLLMLKEAI